MKRKSTSQSAFFSLRVLIRLFVVPAGVLLALVGFGAFSNVFAQVKGTKEGPNAAQEERQTTDVVQTIGTTSSSDAPSTLRNAGSLQIGRYFIRRRCCPS